MSAPAARPGMLQRYRAAALFILIVLMTIGVNIAMGTPFTVRLLAEATAYGLIALGLNVQFGYGGLFNFGVMGFLMLGGFSSVFISFPRNEEFWASDGPMFLLRALAAFIVGALVIWGVRKLPLKGALRNLLVVVAWFAAYVGYRTQLDPAAAYIESTSGWIGGFGFHPVLGWAFGGVLAGIVAYIIGKITLGLRSDYLAIATIGISEIIRALIKNADWLTRGTQNVTPVPWPTPQPQDLQAIGYSITDSFIYSRLMFLVLTAVILLIAYVLIQRAYRGPWGRLMRAIRDNFVAAGSMGKNVKSRQIEIFVFGAVLMGIGGAILTTFNQILDPSGYQPINHTFLVWVMVILGGAGNSFGVLLGAVMLYTVFILSDPIAQGALRALSDWAVNMGWGAIPEIDTRSLQMRVFVVGLVIWLTLRFAPKGLLPEVVRRDP